MRHLNAARPEDLLWVCPIVLGEIECGLRVTAVTDPQRRTQCRRFIEEELRLVHPIEFSTRDSYAEIMECIWRQHPPANGRIKTQAHLSTLGVDVNDIWIAAVSLERNLVLLTEDRMDVIRACVPEIRFDNWLI